MIRLVIFPLIVCSVGCVTQPYEWQFERTECRNIGLSNALFSPNSTDLGLTDIRIGRLPDTGNGPGVAIQFSRNLQQQDIGPTPEIIVAVGDWGRTCSVRMPELACPESGLQYAALANLSLPVGHRFEDPVGIVLFHGTQYFLISNDGEANRLQWSYYGEDHPALQTIDRAIHELSGCASKAWEMYRNGI